MIVNIELSYHGYNWTVPGLKNTITNETCFIGETCTTGLLGRILRYEAEMLEY